MVLKPAKDDKPHVLCSGNNTTGHREQLPYPGELKSSSGLGAGITKECPAPQNSPYPRPPLTLVTCRSPMLSLRAPMAVLHRITASSLLFTCRDTGTYSECHLQPGVLQGLGKCHL